MAGADTKVKPQLIVIQTTSTESLSQNGPAPGRVSTLTGPRPGTLWKIQLVWSSLLFVLTLNPLSSSLTDKATLKIITEQTEVPTTSIMPITPRTMITEVWVL